MGRILMVTCAFGLWAGPVFAQELELAPPKLSARSGDCTLHQQTMCADTHQRALRGDLSCDLCGGRAPLPPDIVAPTGAASGRGKVADECAPRSGPVPSSCVERPRLDTLPKL